MRLVKIICEKRQYRHKLVEYVKKKFYPLDELIQIVQAAQAKDDPTQVKKSKRLKEDLSEALAILLKRKGEYLQSVDLFTNVLIDLSVTEITSALYLDPNIKYNDPTTVKDEHILRFDNITA